MPQIHRQFLRVLSIQGSDKFLVIIFRLAVCACIVGFGAVGGDGIFRDTVSLVVVDRDEEKASQYQQSGL